MYLLKGGSQFNVYKFTCACVYVYTLRACDGICMRFTATRTNKFGQAKLLLFFQITLKEDKAKTDHRIATQRKRRKQRNINRNGLPYSPIKETHNNFLEKENKTMKDYIQEYGLRS